MHGRERRLLARELFVEVARVRASILNTVSSACGSRGEKRNEGTYDLGEVGWWNAFVEDIVEVNVLEEGVAFDLLGVRLA